MSKNLVRPEHAPAYYGSTVEGARLYGKDNLCTLVSS